MQQDPGYVSTADELPLAPAFAAVSAVPGGPSNSIPSTTTASTATPTPPPTGNQLQQAANQDDDDDEENRIAETDPSGRFSRYNTLLGKGAYKEVYKGFDEEEGVEVAWNQLRVDHLAKREAQRILSEIQILKSLRNDHIITMYHAWGAKGPDGRERVFFITELMTAGTLKAYLKKTKGPMRLLVLKKWARQILQGLNYLHSRDPPIIHRDLKCENIFMNGFNGQAKIGDLGLAIPKSRDHASSVLGTPEFMAPELYDENYDEKVDIYAFGMVVLEMVTKEFPYCECTNQYQIYKKVSAGVKPLSLAKITDPETLQFIELCIQFNAKYRPSAAELLTHPFLKLPDAAPGSNTAGSMSSLPPGSGSHMSLDGGSSDGNGSLRVSITAKPAAEHLLCEEPGLHYTTSPHATLSLGRSMGRPASAAPSEGVAGSARELGNPDTTMMAAGRSQSITSTHSNDMVSSFHSAAGVSIQGGVNANPPLPTPPPSLNGSINPGLTTAVSNGSLHSLNTSTPASQQVQQHPPSTVVIELFDRHSESTVTLRMVYTSSGSQSHEIKFPFNLPEDTATDVVSEMVKENLIEGRDEVLARRKLEEKVKGILLGRVEESSRRASEVPGMHHHLQYMPQLGSNTSLQESDRIRTSRGGAGGVDGDSKFATMPRVSSTDEMGHHSTEKPYSTMPRSNASLLDGANGHHVTRSLSNSSLSSSTSSAGSRAQSDSSTRYQPHITPSSSPQPPARKAVQSQSQLQQVTDGTDLPMLSATTSAPTLSRSATLADKVVFTLSQEQHGPFTFDESASILPSSSVSEGYKRGQSGSSVASSDYATSADGLHLRRASHISQVSEGSAAWGTSSISSDSLHPPNSRPFVPPERPPSVTPNPAGPTLALHYQQPHQLSASGTGAAVAYGPVNNPALLNANAANVQQRLLELQERSLKDLGSGINSGRNTTVQAGGAVPHINHHAVHHPQHHHPQFHPHHAASYPGVQVPMRTASGSSANVWNPTGAGAGMTSNMPLSAGGRPIMVPGGALGPQSKASSAAGIPPSTASPSLGNVGATKIAPAGVVSSAAFIPVSRPPGQQQMPPQQANLYPSATGGAAPSRTGSH